MPPRSRESPTDFRRPVDDTQSISLPTGLRGVAAPAASQAVPEKIAWSLAGNLLRHG